MIVKKYANRRLYDTRSSRYITLDELAEAIRKGAEPRIIDAKTDADLTQATLAQIILESRGASKLLPAPLLMQLIRMGDDALAEFFGSYIGWSLGVYIQAKQQAAYVAQYNPFAAPPSAPFPNPFTAPFPGGPNASASPFPNPFGNTPPPTPGHAQAQARQAWGNAPPPPAAPNTHQPPPPVSPNPTHDRVPEPPPAPAPPSDTTRELNALREELEALKAALMSPPPKTDDA